MTPSRKALLRARDYISTYHPSYGSYSTPPYEAREDALKAIDAALDTSEWQTLSDEEIIAATKQYELSGDAAKIFAGGALWATQELGSKNI